MAKQLHLQENAAVDISVDRGALRIEPLAHPALDEIPDINELIDRITPENPHALVKHGYVGGERWWEDE